MSETGTDPPVEEDSEGIVTPWSSVTVTFIISAIQGLVFYSFFLYQRGKEKAKDSYDLYETRQHGLSHRSPPPYSPDKAWWRAAWELDDEETLRCVGLDTFMFLRFLRLGARICAIGSLLACVLIPAYATADERGAPTEQFNQLTLARVEKEAEQRAAKEKKQQETLAKMAAKKAERAAIQAKRDAN